MRFDGAQELVEAEKWQHIPVTWLGWSLYFLALSSMEQGCFVVHPRSPTNWSETTNLREGKKHNSIAQKRDPTHGTPLWSRVGSGLKPPRTKSWPCSITKHTFMHVMQYSMIYIAISINMHKLYVVWHFESLQLEISKCRMKAVLWVNRLCGN